MTSHRTEYQAKHVSMPKPHLAFLVAIAFGVATMFIALRYGYVRVQRGFEAAIGPASGPELHDRSSGDDRGSTTSLDGAPPGLGETQFEFTGPVGMTIRMTVPEDTNGLRQFAVPARHNLSQGFVYDLMVRDITGHPGVHLEATLEVVQSVPRVRAFLNQNAIPLSIMNEDVEAALRRNPVTKVMYIADPEFEELAQPVETIVSHRLDLDFEPIAAAERRGDIVAVMRIRLEPAMPPQ